MENQASKFKLPLILLAIVLVLGGGGYAIWRVLRKDNGDGEQPETANTEEPPLTGRENVSNQNPGLTYEDIQNLFSLKDPSFGNNGGSGGGGGGGTKTPPPPLYIKSAQAQELIKAKAERIQANEQVMNIIRAKYDIGRALIDFNVTSQFSIDSLMLKVAGTDFDRSDPKRYLNYPIYGTHEPRGDQARKELQNFLDQDKTGYTLANARHSGAPWWIPSIQVNLLIGTDTANTPTADQVWWSAANRQEVDWFKAMNGIWVNDNQLTEGNPPWYWAGTTYTFVERWVEAIDRLDLVTEWEAIRTLSAPKKLGGDGWVFTYIDPNTGDDLTTNFKPDTPTDPSSGLIIP